MDGVTGNFTVGYLDLLGFKQKIDSQPISQLATQYETLVQKLGRLLNEVEYNGQRFPLCKRFIFSDSIILIPEKEQTVENWRDCFCLLAYAWKFTQIALSIDFPIRGAIAYGEMYINEKDQIFLGKALTKAYELEQQQDWIGVTIDPSVFVAYPELDKAHPLLNDILFEYLVPMKNDRSETHRTLNWRWNMVSQHGTRALFKESMDSSVQEKQNNTLAYAKKVIESGRIYPSVDQSSIPELFRTFWVGNNEPPFEHGDDL